MRANQIQLTEGLLRYCYTCDNAHECDTEIKCMECWRENEFTLAEEAEADTTEELLRLYAL